MQVDLLGRLRNTKLAERNALLPLYEAVVNAIDAIEERGSRSGIEIKIERDYGPPESEKHGNFIPPVLGFTVIDSGIGFTEANFRAFDTIDTTAKYDRGGKGIGRILWLKAFERVRVSSVFEDYGRWYLREFDFVATPRGIENPRLEEARPSQSPAPRTEVRLINFLDPYRAVAPKSAEHIGRKIIDHALELFILGRAPGIVVTDQQQMVQVDLNELFEESYRPQANARQFVIEEHTFEILDVLLQPDGEVKHHISFCAHDRVVRQISPANRIPHLETTLAGQGNQPLVYAGYVSSGLLDGSVQPDRTGFDLDRRGELDFSVRGIAWDDVEEAAVREAESFLTPMTEGARARARARVEQFIKERAPRFRPLLKRRPAALSAIPSNLSDDKLEIALHREFSEWTYEVRDATEATLANLDSGDAFSLAAFEREFAPLFEQIQEVAKAELSEYVWHRRNVLMFFEKMLGRQEDARFPLEAAVHEMLFSRKRTSDDVNYEDHNLWLLDERLAFHHYLASDLPLDSGEAPVRAAGRGRPDVLVFNRRLAFTGDETSISSVVVIEFKRPERDDHGENENPIDQVLDYVDLLRAGRETRDSGRTINLPPTVPFYCYIVASLTPNLRRQAERADFTPAPDGLGFFSYHKNLSAYIEVLSYEKVLNDAKKRNRAFFERLDMPL